MSPTTKPTLFFVLAIAALSMVFSQASAQSAFTQKVRGQVIDAESKQSIPGVLIVLLSDMQRTATTDSNGYFIMADVPVGRQSFHFRFTGYETYTASDVLVISGKELELNVTMKENLRSLNEVTVSAGKDRAKPLNEFAAVSARSFSVEETRRYAAAFADPSRMVMNFPGVSNAGDMENGIVVRGNSSKGVLYRLEGIEIPNPNHFSAQGAVGGAISMLNANTLGNSDFYTGAFPAEVGNATAGVFDLNLRNGNTDHAEHTVQVGALGVEVATEGPFKKGKKASYLFNYRYSTTALLKGFLDLGSSVPAYQDMSFKVNLPTKKAGTFSLFGLGGMNEAIQTAIADSTKWDDDNTSLQYVSKGKMGVAGITHQYFLNKDAYFRTIVSASYDKSGGGADTLNATDGYRQVPIENSAFTNTALRVSVMYNEKLNTRNTIRTGIIAQQYGYDLQYQYFDNVDNEWKNSLSGKGNAQFYQGYFQWKSRLTERLTFNGGLHGSYFALNGKSSIEPRANMTYDMGHQKVTLAAGLHSKPEHISTYLFQNAKPGDPITYPNKDLDMQRSFHSVAGYSTTLPWKLRFKAEVYYQKLYSIAVEQDSSRAFSLINAEGAYSLLATEKSLTSTGTGQNYGIDLSIEKPFSNNWYVLATGSIYKSTYKDFYGRQFSTKYDRGYQANLLGGKEFKINASGRKILGLNGKILFSGGMRESLIDLEKSKLSGRAEIVPGEFYTQQVPAYFRTDIGIYYKINNRKATHTILFEAQNVTNRQNYYFSYFDRQRGTIRNTHQLGILPNISYRIDFHW